MATFGGNPRRLLELLDQNRHSSSTKQLELQLAEIDYGLTTTLNDEPEFSGHISLENGFKNEMNSPRLKSTAKTKECKKTEDIALDTLILSMLHELNGDYSIVLKFDDSLLKRPGDFVKLTSSLTRDRNRYSFLSDLLKIKNLDSNIDVIIGISRYKVIHVLNCFEHYFSVNFCLNFYMNGGFTQISSQSRTSEKKHIYLTKIDSNPEFRAIVPRKDLYADSRLYFTSIANDILRYKLFQNHFRSWANSKTDSSSLMLDTPEFYNVLKKCSSIDEIIQNVFPDGHENVMFPLLKLRVLLRENHLDRAITKEIIVLVKENISLEFNLIVQSMTAKKLEEENRNYELFRDIEENAIQMIQEAKQFCELQEQKQVELSGELATLQSRQNKILEDKDELKNIQEKIFMAKGYIDWTKFKCDFLHAELKYKSFSDYQLDILNDPNFDLGQIISLIGEWFSVPSQCATESPEFLKYTEQNKDEIRQECLRILKHMQSVNINVSIDEENAAIAVTGFHLNLSQVLARIPHTRTSNLTEIRVIAKGTLFVDKDVVFRGKNVLLCGNHVVVTKVVKIDTSGTNGIPFLPNEMKAEDATIEGGCGRDGNDGNDGTSAGNVTIISKAPLIGKEDLRISANGGNGADGQNGGNGMIGRVGEDGIDGNISEPTYGQVWGVSEDSRQVVAEGTPGKPGGHGGKGGKPGKGGKAGQCGQITIKSGAEEVTMRENISCLAGNPGNVGDWGQVGISGKGGRNGYDHGWATESFWWWDDWIEGKGKLEFEEVSTWFKRGYKIIILRTVDQVHNTFALTRDTDVSHGTISGRFVRETRVCDPMRPINMEAPNLQGFLDVCNQAPSGEVSQALREEDELQSRLIEVSSTQDQATLTSIGERIQSNRRELDRTRESLHEGTAKISRCQSTAESARPRKLDSLKKREELKETMESLRKWEKEFLEGNKMTVQTQEQVETRISPEFHNFNSRDMPGRPPELNFNQLSSELYFDPEHLYITEGKQILSTLSVSDKSAFEESLQKCIFHSITLKADLPQNFFKTIQGLSVSGAPRGYDFSDYVSKIFPSDLQMCLEFRNDKSFFDSLLDVFSRICRETSVVHDTFDLICKLRHWKPETQTSGWNPFQSKSNPILELETFVAKSEDPLKKILEDILERNCVEAYVEQVLLSQESSRAKKAIKTLKKSPRRWGAKIVNYLWTSELEGGADVDTHEEVGQDTAANDEDEEEFGLFGQTEISAAKSEVVVENQVKGIISEPEIRQLARTALKVYKELKVFISDLSLAECLDQKYLDSRKLMTNDAIWNFITSCTGINLDTIDYDLRTICNPESSVNSQIIPKPIRLPFYVFILSNVDIDLPRLSVLHALSSAISKIRKYQELETKIYQIYLERFQNPRIRRLKDSEQLEKIIESEYTGLNLEERIEKYEEALNSNSDSFIEISEELCSINFRSSSLPEFNACTNLFNKNQTSVNNFISVLGATRLFQMRAESKILNILFQKLCLHFQLQQLGFQLNDLKLIGEIIGRIEETDVRRSVMFQNLRKEFVKTLRNHLESKVTKLTSKFDTSGNTWTRCLGILELVLECTRNTQNEQRILQNFDILVHRIYLVLIENGRSDQIETLIDQIDEIKSRCPEPIEFLCELNLSCLEFLKTEQWQFYECDDSELKNLPFQESDKRFYTIAIEIIEQIPREFKDSKHIEFIASVIHHVTSSFMSRHSYESLQNLLYPPTTQSSQNLVRNEAPTLGDLKKIVISRLGIQENKIRSALRSLRDTLNWSTRTTYEKEVSSRISREKMCQDANVKDSMEKLSKIATNIFDLLLRKEMNAPVTRVINFIENSDFHDINLTDLTSDAVLDKILQTFISEFLLPNIEFSNSANICNTLFQTILIFLRRTFQNKDSGEENTIMEKTEEEKVVRFKFFKIFESLAEISAETCWKYTESLLEFVGNLEELHSQFIERKETQFSQSMMTFLIKVVKNLTKNEAIVNPIYSKIVSYVEDEKPFFHFTVAKIFLNIRLESKKLGRELTEEEFWACFCNILEKQRNHALKVFPRDFQNFTFPKMISLALTHPAIARSERIFLCKMLENCPQNYELHCEKLKIVKNYFKLQENDVCPNQTFWIDLLRSDILEFLTTEEKMLLDEIYNFKRMDQITHEITELLITKIPNEWPKTLRDYLLEKISAKFYGSDVDDDDCNKELRTFHFFSRQNYSEDKFFEIMKNLCDFLQKFGNVNKISKKSLLKYATHITLDELNDILKSKLPGQWLAAILRSRIFLRIRELFHGKENASLGDLFEKIDDSFLRIKDERILEVFLLQLGDALLKESAENAEYIYGYLENICALVTPKKLTVRVLQELAGSSLNCWKLCFRRAELSEMDLSGTTISLLLDIESKASSPELTNKFLRNFKKYCPDPNELFLNGILSKIDSGEWFLSEETIRILETADGGSTISLDTILLDHFKKSAEEKKGRVLEGDELVKELTADPINKHLVLSLTNQLVHDLRNIRKPLEKDYHFDARIAPKRLSEWTQNDISNWSRQIKAELHGMSPSAKFDKLMEQKSRVLAVICRASYLMEKQYEVWDTQLLSVLIFLQGSLASQKSPNGVGMGRLGEISTGEGKTLITAILAIFWSLAGGNVNIITSTHVLAEANEKEMMELFAVFKIGVGNNCDKKCREGGDRERKIRYSNQVIYGDISSFQSDILQVENFGKDLFGNREPDFVFVDEVDSLFLDKGGHMLYISHSIPEFRYLRPIFVKIWSIVNRELEENVHEVAKIVREELTRDEILIPNYLEKFMSARLVTWVENAYQAKRMREDDPYIVSDKEGRKVTIIDPDTGVEQPSMQYSFGLHQFIELKHYDRLSCESLRAIFMSNFSYFQRYRGKLYGITGTLGSEKSREIMSRRYEVDFFAMKRRKVRYCPAEEGRVAGNEGEWLEFIKESVLGKINDGRAVLVIGENVERVKRITAFLQQTLPNVRSYESSTDTNFIDYIQKNQVEVGIVIVGTNLAGRGTDLRISENVNGGLHVILAYIPANSRIEAQAFGRTARKGEDGSTEFIVLHSTANGPMPSIEELRIHREALENYRLEKMDTEQFKRVELEEKLFVKFREYTCTLATTEHFKKLSEQFKKLDLEFIRNRWAIWLDLMNDQIKRWKLYGEENLLGKFSDFKNEIEDAIQSNKMATAPSELVKLAKEHENNRDIDNALELLTRAIDKEPNFCEISLYYKAVCLLKKSPYSKDERQDAIGLLKKARRLIKKTIENCTILTTSLDQTNVTAGGNEAGKNFATQMNNHCELLQKHIDAIDSAIGVRITPDIFMRVTGVCDRSEAEDLFKLTRKSLSPMKPFRISKKVDMRDGKLFVAENEVKLPLPPYCPDDMVKVIADLPSRDIEPDAFMDVIMTKQKFWDILANSNAFQLQKSFQEYRINYSDHTFPQIQFPAKICNQKASIGLILMEYNLQIYDNRIFDDLNLTSSDMAGIEAFLRIHGILQPLKRLVGTFRTEFLETIDFNANIIPLELRKYSVILATWLQNEDGSLKTTISTLDNVPLLCDKEYLESQVQKLWTELIHHGIIKECTIDISIRRDFCEIKSKIGEMERAVDNLKNEYTHIYEKHHGVAVSPYKNKKKSELTQEEATSLKEYNKSLELYLTSIKFVLKSSIGSLKSFEKIRADFDKMEENYEASNFPHEIIEYIMSDFERVLKFSETVVWWKSGGFIVSMLGVLQTVAGIGLMFLSPNIGIGVLSEGLGDIYYGYSGGYTNPNFSWSQYGIQKGISLLASTVTCGLSPSSGLTVGRLAMEVGEEAVKRAVIYRAVRVIGSHFSGAIIHHCFNYVKDCVLRRLKSLFTWALPYLPGYQTQMQHIRTKLEDLLGVNCDPNQAMKIMQDSLKFVFNEENSVFRTQLNNVMARVVPQIIGNISSAMTSTGTKFVQAFDMVMLLFQWSKLIMVFQEMAYLAEKGLKGLNEHLRHKINNLDTQRQQGFSVFADGATNTYNEGFVDTYIEGINQQITRTILDKFQQDIAEPAANRMAQTALMYGYQRYFDEQRQTTLLSMRENRRGVSTSNAKNNHPETSQTVQQNNENYFGNIHMDNMVQNSNPPSTIRQLYQERGEGLRIYQDKHGKYYADL